MKLFFKFLFISWLDFCMVGKTLLFCVFSFCFQLSAESRSVTESLEREDGVLIEQEENSDQKARGLIVRFHRWPSLKEQKELNRILKSRGLKRSKSIRSFKAQLFAWREGGLKASRFGEQACLKLKSLSYVRRCAPDHLLSPNTAKFLLASAGLEKSSQTEVGFNFECENCKDLGQKIVWETSRKVLNLKTCDIVSRKRKLKKERDISPLYLYMRQAIPGITFLA